jgi:hypothetical protein
MLLDLITTIIFDDANVSRTSSYEGSVKSHVTSSYVQLSRSTSSTIYATINYLKNVHRLVAFIKRRFGDSVLCLFSGRKLRPLGQTDRDSPYLDKG